VAAALAIVVAGTGCSEVRGRRLLQKANGHYRNAEYAEAVTLFKEAERSTSPTCGCCGSTRAPPAAA
jgi:hypothetical protein